MVWYGTIVLCVLLCGYIPSTESGCKAAKEILRRFMDRKPNDADNSLRRSNNLDKATNIISLPLHQDEPLPVYAQLTPNLIERPVSGNTVSHNINFNSNINNNHIKVPSKLDLLELQSFILGLKANQLKPVSDNLKDLVQNDPDIVNYISTILQKTGTTNYSLQIVKMLLDILCGIKDNLDEDSIIDLMEHVSQLQGSKEDLNLVYDTLMNHNKANIPQILLRLMKVLNGKKVPENIKQWLSVHVDGKDIIANVESPGEIKCEKKLDNKIVCKKTFVVPREISSELRLFIKNILHNKLRPISPELKEFILTFSNFPKLVENIFTKDKISESKITPDMIISILYLMSNSTYDTTNISTDLIDFIIHLNGSEDLVKSIFEFMKINDPEKLSTLIKYLLEINNYNLPKYIEEWVQTSSNDKKLKEICKYLKIKSLPEEIVNELILFINDLNNNKLNNLSANMLQFIKQYPFLNELITEIFQRENIHSADINPEVVVSILNLIKDKNTNKLNNISNNLLILLQTMIGFDTVLGLPEKKSTEEITPIPITTENPVEDDPNVKEIRIKGPPEIINGFQAFLEDIQSGRPIKKIPTDIINFIIKLDNSDDLLEYMFEMAVENNPNAILPLLKKIKQSNNGKLPNILKSKLIPLIENDNFDMSDDLFMFIIIDSILPDNPNNILALLKHKKQSNKGKFSKKLESKLVSLVKNIKDDIPIDLLSYIFDLTIENNPHEILPFLTDIKKANNGKILAELESKLLNFVKNNMHDIPEDLLTYIFDLTIENNPHEILPFLTDIKKAHNGKILAELESKLLNFVKNNMHDIPEDLLTYIFDLTIENKPQDILPLLKQIKKANNGKILAELESKLLNFVKNNMHDIPEDLLTYIFDLTIENKPQEILLLLKQIKKANNGKIPAELESKLLNLVKYNMHDIPDDLLTYIFDLTIENKPQEILLLLKQIKKANNGKIPAELESKLLNLVKYNMHDIPDDLLTYIFDLTIENKPQEILLLLKQIKKANNGKIPAELESKLLNLVKYNMHDIPDDLLTYIFDLTIENKPQEILLLLKQIKKANNGKIPAELESKLMSYVIKNKYHVPNDLLTYIFDLTIENNPHEILSLLKEIKKANNGKIPAEIESKLVLLAKINKYNIPHDLLTYIFDLTIENNPHEIVPLLAEIKEANNGKIPAELESKIVSFVKNNKGKMSDDVLINIFDLISSSNPNLMLQLLIHIKNSNNGKISSKLESKLLSLVRNNKYKLSDDVLTFIFDLISSSNPNLILKLVKNIEHSNNGKIPAKIKSILVSLIKINNDDIPDDLLTYIFESILLYNPKAVIFLLEDMRKLTNNSKLPAKFASKLLSLIRNNKFNISEDLLIHMLDLIPPSNSNIIFELLKTIKRSNNGKISAKVESKLLSLLRNNNYKMPNDIVALIFDLISSSSPHLMLEILKNIEHSNNGKIPAEIISILSKLVRKYKFDITDNNFTYIFNLLSSNKPSSIKDLLKNIKLLDNDKYFAKLIIKLLSLVRHNNYNVKDVVLNYIYNVISSQNSNSILKIFKNIKQLTNGKIPSELITILLKLVQDKKFDNLGLTYIFDLILSDFPNSLKDLLENIKQSNGIIPRELISKLFSFVSHTNKMLEDEVFLYIFNLMATNNPYEILTLAEKLNTDKNGISPKLKLLILSLLKNNSNNKYDNLLKQIFAIINPYALETYLNHIKQIHHVQVPKTNTNNNSNMNFNMNFNSNMNSNRRAMGHELEDVDNRIKVPKNNIDVLKKILAATDIAFQAALDNSPECAICAQVVLEEFKKNFLRNFT